MALAREKLPYCVVGGLAVNAHGVPRPTYNVDLVVLPDRAVLRRLNQLLSELGLVCHDPVRLEDFADEAIKRRWLFEQNRVRVRFGDPAHVLHAVDVVVAPPLAPVELVRRARPLKWAGVTLRVAAVNDLMAMKRVSGWLGDADDVARLEHAARARKTRR